MSWEDGGDCPPWLWKMKQRLEALSGAPGKIGVGGYFSSGNNGLCWPIWAFLRSKGKSLLHAGALRAGWSTWRSASWPLTLSAVNSSELHYMVHGISAMVRCPRLPRANLLFQIFGPIDHMGARSSFRTGCALVGYFWLCKVARQRVLATRGRRCEVCGLWRHKVEVWKLPPAFVSQMALNRLICLFIHSINIHWIWVKHCSGGCDQMDKISAFWSNGGKEQRGTITKIVEQFM